MHSDTKIAKESSDPNCFRQMFVDLRRQLTVEATCLGCSYACNKAKLYKSLVWVNVDCNYYVLFDDWLISHCTLDSITNRANRSSFKRQRWYGYGCNWYGCNWKAFNTGECLKYSMKSNVDRCNPTGSGTLVNRSDEQEPRKTSASIDEAVSLGFSYGEDCSPWLSLIYLMHQAIAVVDCPPLYLLTNQSDNGTHSRCAN